jgi:hypothetical protein
MSVFVNNYYNVEDLYTTEKEKNTFDYLSKSVDYYITSLVNEKPRIKKARNLYEGIRDREEFRYLEETFGIETPIAVKMTPLIKTRIDVLLGLLLDEVFTYRVSVNDNNTLTDIENKKKNERAERIIAGYRKQMNGNINKLKQGQPPVADVVTQKFLDRIEKSINDEFISQFEIACQSLLQFFEQDNTIDLKQKVKQFFLDLLISGEAFYRTYVDRLGEDPKIEICKPENIFFSKRTDHQFLSSGTQPNVNAVVHRTYMKRSEILNKWGHLMNETDKKRIFGDYDGTASHNLYDPRALDYVYRQDSTSESIHNQHTNNDLDTLPVYHTEWLANNVVELTDDRKDSLRNVEGSTISKKWSDTHGKGAGSGAAKKHGYRLDRYEGVRIGDDIYLNMGKSRWTPRSIGQPWVTTLSYNGVAYNDRNGTPYSITLALKDLQDSYDIIHFFRDNLIANSGVDGSRINLAAIPKVLGQDYMERILKFMAFRKQGVELYDPTEDGAHLFNHYGDFKGSLNGQIVESLNSVLESIERQADVVTGVNRHMYAAAEVRDAVSNVKVGQQQTSLITKDIFELVYTSRKHMLTDLINQAKITYRKGKRGSYIVGHRTILFDAFPEHFCFTDYNIHIINSSKENLKLEKLSAIIPELAAAGVLGHDVIVKMTMSESPTEILKLIEDSMAKHEESNDIAGQLQQQLEQMQGQLKEVEGQLQQAQKQADAASEQEVQLKVQNQEMQTYESRNRVRQGDERLDLDRYSTTEEVKKDQEIVQLEREQLYAENAQGNSKEVRNNF